MRLLERDAELAAMDQRWRRACARAGSFLLVGGESGIGKTQLVRAFAEQAVEHGRVAWGACDPLYTPRPLGPLHDGARHGAPPSETQRAELLELLAAELYLTDRLEDAIAARERAMALRHAAGDLGGVGADHEALSVYHWYNANRAVAERYATAAVEVLERTVDLPRLGHAYAMEAYLALQHSDFGRARAFHERARQVAGEAGDRQLDARVEIIDAVRALMDGDIHGRDRILSLIEREAEFFDEIHSAGYSNLAYLDVEQRRLDEAGAVLAHSLPLTSERDIPICVRGRLAFVRGQWDTAVADADAVLDGQAAPWPGPGRTSSAAWFACDAASEAPTTTSTRPGRLRVVSASRCGCFRRSPHWRNAPGCSAWKTSASTTPVSGWRSWRPRAGSDGPREMPRSGCDGSATTSIPRRSRWRSRTSSRSRGSRSRPRLHRAPSGRRTSGRWRSWTPATTARRSPRSTSSTASARTRSPARSAATSAPVASPTSPVAAAPPRARTRPA